MRMTVFSCGYSFLRELTLMVLSLYSVKKQRLNVKREGKGKIRQNNLADAISTAKHESEVQ